MIAWSGHLYARFDLSTDFGVFYQAWHQIAHGDLNPYSTLNPHNYPHYGYPFWRNHFELLMWPMALLWFVYPHGIVLLWVQDLAIAGATLVAFFWSCEILERHWSGGRGGIRGVALGSLVVLFANPWTWWSASFDFHLQALATLIVLLAGRDLWRGRRRMWVWVGILLLCGNVSVSYLVGLGITGLLMSRRTRRTGAALVALSVGALAVIGAIGGSEGTLISNYAYLAGAGPGQAAGLGSILGGIVSHPGRALRMLKSRLEVIYYILAASGLVGIVAPIGLGIGLVVLISNELNGSPVFASPDASFQSLPVYYFVLVGTVAGLAWLARRHLARAKALTVALGAVLLVQALVLSALWLPRARSAFSNVGSAAAAQLEAISGRIPPGAEVVASQGVVGRFSGRRLAYPFLDIYDNGQTVPVYGSSVYFVLAPSEGIEYATASQTLSAVAFLQRDLHAAELSRSAGIYAFRWTRPRGISSITFPRSV
jgi:hypothetical protein